MSVVIKFPSTTQEIVSGWNDPENAYAEDGSKAYASPPDNTTKPEQKYGGWGFTEDDIPPGSIIDKVEIGAKHYETDPSGYYQYTDLKYVNSGGSSTTYSLTRRSSLTWDWIDITDKETSWDLDKLNNADVRIISKLTSSSSGGCFIETEDEKCYFILKDEEGWLIKPVSEIKPGDKLFVWHPKLGFKTEPVLRVKAYEGEFNIVEIWSGRFDRLPRLPDKTEFMEWIAHITVTEKQVLPVYKKAANIGLKKFAGPEIITAREIWERVKAGEQFWVGHLWGPKITIMMFPIEKCALRTYIGKVYDIKIADKECRMFCKTLHIEELRKLEKWGYTLQKQAELGPPFLAIASKYTSYVDAVAIRVTYTPPAEGGQYYTQGDGLGSEVKYVG